RRAESGREFLASTDPAFRPVNLATGPDGALYLVDMYRELVEHPDFVPAELRTKVEFRRWHDRGRIWRIRSRTGGASASGRPPRPRLETASVSELVRHLGHPVGWYAVTAQRLLVERQDRAALPLIEQAFRSEASPTGRLHALWTLHGLGALNAGLLEHAAADPDPLLREHALRVLFTDRRLLEGFPRARVIALAGDPEVRVRPQAAILLGELADRDPEAVRALVALARRDGDDPWVRLGILSGLAERAIDFLREWARTDAGSRPAGSSGRRLLSEAAAIVGVRRRGPELRSLLELLSSPVAEGEVAFRGLDDRLALTAGLGEGLGRSGPPLHAWLAGIPASQRGGAEVNSALWARARSLADSNEEPSRRKVALEVLVRGAPDLARPLLPKLARAEQPAEIQAAAARALGQLASAQQIEELLDGWGSLGLGTRRGLLSAMAANPAHARLLIDALDDQKLAVVELDAAARDALLRGSDPPRRRRLEAILSRFAPEDRSTVVEKYQAALHLVGDRSRGEGVFVKNCQTCHERQGRGHRVGPDLSGIAGRLPGVLLSDILHPNRDVAPDYVALSVATRDGQVLSGLLVEETVSGVKLRQAEGVERTVLRSEIAEIRSSGRSLMPDGLEQAIKPQDMADLLAFLRSGSR
ncbi:MAG: c-type cytochrome, partial [Isosphaeraceae bacterium]